jgi:hypothetical protein
MALWFIACGRVMFDRGADGGGVPAGTEDAGLIAISTGPDAGPDGQAPAAEATGGRGSGGSAGGASGSGAGGAPGAGGSPGAGGAPGTGGAAVMPATAPPPGGAGGTPGCRTQADCKDGICNLLNQQCIDCLLDSDCKKGKGKLCDLTSFTCVECRIDADCGGNKSCGADGTCSN